MIAAETIKIILKTLSFISEKDILFPEKINEVNL